MGEETGAGRGLIYEVPDDLKYEERAIWVFTLKQLAVFSVFAGAAALIFLKVNADIKLRLAAAGAIVCIGFTFATFAPLQEEVVKRIRYIWAPKRAVWTQPETLTRFIRVKKVCKQHVKLLDGRLLSILAVTPVDFGVLSETQKLALLASYRQFLNSLSFPIQILVRTTKLDLQAYFAGAKARAAAAKDTKALAELEAFEEFVQDYVSSRGVHDRLFYIVISQKPDADEEQALRQLEYKTATCMEKLSAGGLVARRLTENQLISLYASFYGGHVEADADYLSIVSMLEMANEKKSKRGAFQKCLKR